MFFCVCVCMHAHTGMCKPEVNVTITFPPHSLQQVLEINPELICDHSYWPVCSGDPLSPHFRVGDIGRPAYPLNENKNEKGRNMAAPRCGGEKVYYRHLGSAARGRDSWGSPECLHPEPCEQGGEWKGQGREDKRSRERGVTKLAGLERSGQLREGKPRPWARRRWGLRSGVGECVQSMQIGFGMQIGTSAPCL